MGKLRGFLEFERKVEEYLPVKDRVKHYQEFTKDLSKQSLLEQGGRCMSCGIPFCHSGCPLGNLIPDFNDAVYRNSWKEALDILHTTNNFPEFTGRLCPAPCEAACVLGIIKPPVSIETIEKYIVEKGFEKGWIVPHPPSKRTGKKVAVVGSGPSGLAAAQQLNRAGHLVTVFERDSNIGGLLRYGIPNFKLDKNIIDRRLKILEAEGIIFRPNTHIGVDFQVEELGYFDAVVLAGGATQKRELPIEGSELEEVIQAMAFLSHQNKVVEGSVKPIERLSAKGKHVIVIGGGDTGSDCIGTSNRHGALSVTNFEIMPMPPKERTRENPWPYWPFTLKTSSSHQEGVVRTFSVLTKEFISDKNGKLKALKTVDVKWEKNDEEPPKLKEIKGSEKEWSCNLVLLALGFKGPEKTLSEKLNLELDNHSNIKTDKNYQTNIPNIFTAGDMRRGQSLIVWAISEGREVAHHVDKYLMGYSDLPIKEKGDLPTVN
ncbi:glutamate synthase (NADH) small subunit [Elysia marginata]|uniref:Glutamate synthase (NADH) small subunit n=1 Tax=Elysia marginata TaxID=1093978 RepID=A0AAV4FPU7_9GAST|nr:glutamate synthase (NADH) small subunit [Elysia marginata]